MSRHYKKTIDGVEYKYPSVTTIISGCTDASGALTQWAANMTVEHIRENCNGVDKLKELTLVDVIADGVYLVSELDFNDARFNVR